MNPLAAIALSLCLSTISIAHAQNETLVRTTDPLTPEEEQKLLKLPPGFEISLFASEPMINKPINLAYDARGRLWVSSTVEYPYAAKKDRWSDPQGSSVRDSKDAIKILEDTDGDGTADKVTDFADRLNIPTGVLPWHKPEHKDGCIGWSIPNIWYFADTSGDGKCDHREVLFGPLGYERDTHGMCSSFRMSPWPERLAPPNPGNNDVWVYATHGFNNTSVLKAKDGTSIELHSGNVFRFRPDGSTVEVWTRGQVNPFGLGFDRRGNLYSADCHSAPVYQLLQGAIYPSFGKPHDGLGFGPAMIQHTHGSTGICGIAYIDRDQWGADWNDHLLIGNPVTSRINHDRIEFRGSTPVAVEQKDFLVSNDPWFRPVDLCQGDDGALYVADFYNRIIGHYEVPLTHLGRDRKRGRIWRITRTGKSKPPSALEAPKIIANRITALSDPSPFVQRRAAHQLQLSPSSEGLMPLLTTLENTPTEDTHLRHVLRMALREHLKQPGAFDHIPSKKEIGVDPRNLRFQKEHLAEIASIAPAIPNARAAALLAAHPDRATYLRHIARYGDEPTLQKLVSGIRKEGSSKTKLARIDAIQTGLDERGRSEPLPELLVWAEELATELLKTKVKAAPAEWTSLPHPDKPTSKPPWTHQQRQCADGKQATVLSSLRIGEGAVEQRTGILESQEFSAPKALAFWICGHRGHPDQKPHDKNYVRLIDAAGKELRRAYPPKSDICQNVTWKIPAEQVGKPVRLQIIDGDTGNAYAWLGITRIAPQATISTDSFQRAGDLDESLTQLAGLLKLTAPVALRDQLKPWLPKPSTPITPQPVSPEQRKQIDQLIQQRVVNFAKAKAAGSLDPKRGAEVFQQNCAVCHQIDRKGGLIGPQLDGIGTRGVERLTEDILDPNRNVDSHFYITQFMLKDGTGKNAFVLSERGQSLQIRDLGGGTERLPKSQIQSKETLPTSLMPTAFGHSIPAAQFRDLLAWLLQ